MHTRLVVSLTTHESHRDTMKYLVLAVCISCAVAAYSPLPSRPPLGSAPPVKSSGSDVDAVILKADSIVGPEGFNYAYETGNGIVGSAVGDLKKVENIDALVVRGHFKYVDADGTPVNVEYVADENGYQPISDILPTPPPIPTAILRALEYLAAHPPEEEKIPVKYRN